MLLFQKIFVSLPRNTLENQLHLMIKKLLITLLAVAASTALSFAASPIWRAQKQSVFEPSADGNTLIFSFDAYYVYNSQGQPVEMTTIDVDGVKQRTLTTYADGRATRELTEQLVGDNWTPVKLRERTYDSQTGVITSNVETNYFEGKEMPGNCYRRVIRRNPAGAVYEVTISVLYQGRYEPTQKITIKPNSISFSELEYVTGSWRTTLEYTDIVWERTDGQIVTIDDLFTGANRLASAHFVNPNGNKPYYDYDITATYGEGNDFDCRITGLYQALEDAEVIREYRETMEPDGSATYVMTTSYDIVDSAEPAELYREELKVDAWGLETLYCESSWLEGEEPVVDVERTTDVTYDSTIGYPLQAVASEDGQLITRIDFADYVDCTQLTSIREIAASGGGKIYFNLKGQRVRDSFRGIKISRYGAEAQH